MQMRDDKENRKDEFAPLWLYVFIFLSGSAFLALSYLKLLGIMN